MEIMVFPSEEKAVIKNDFIEKEWSAYGVCKEHPTRNWNKVFVQRLLNCFEKHGTIHRGPGSGRPRTATSEENEEMICSQEENPGTHMSPRGFDRMKNVLLLKSLSILKIVVFM